MSSFEAEPRPLGRVSFVPDPLPAGPGARGFRDASGGAPRDAAPAEESPEERTQRAYERGLAEGRAALPWNEAEALRTATAALEEAARAFHDLRRSYLLAQRRAVLDLALAVAERILARELRVNEEALLVVVARALEHMGAEGGVEIRVAPGDRETLQRGLARELAAFAEAAEIHVVADPSLAPGTLRVSGEASEVDLRLGSILERLREELDEALGAPEPEASS